MALSERDVRGIADYARIALTDEELTEMTAYMNGAITGVLEPVLQYGEADVPPTFHPIGDLSNVMGADVVAPASRSRTPCSTRPARATATSVSRPSLEARSNGLTRYPLRRPDCCRRRRR